MTQGRKNSQYRCVAMEGNVWAPLVVTVTRGYRGLLVVKAKNMPGTVPMQRSYPTQMPLALQLAVPAIGAVIYGYVPTLSLPWVPQYLS